MSIKIVMWGTLITPRPTGVSYTLDNLCSEGEALSCLCPVEWRRLELR